MPILISSTTILGPNELKLFLGTRARLQRLSDAKFVGAWILEVTETELRAKLSTKIEFQQGDIFYVEMYSATVSAMCKARYVTNHGEDAIFAFLEAVKPLPAKETLRIFVTDIAGKLLFDGVQYEITAHDVSAEGIGLVGACFAARGSVVSVELDTPHGPVSFSGEVRYCRPENPQLKTFRLGLMLQTMGRLEKARWARLFEEYTT